MRILPDEEVEPAARKAMAESIAARSELSPDAIDILIELACQPQSRMQISPDDLRVWGSHFGHAEEEALRAIAAAKDADRHHRRVREPDDGIQLNRF